MTDDSNPASRPRKSPCLLSLLQPIRHCLHPFLSGTDVMCLMRASQSVTADLLSDCPFVDHVFRLPSGPQAKHAFAFIARCGRYRMRLLRMCLPVHWNKPLVDGKTGRLLLPGSLLALTLGGSVDFSKTIAHAAFDGREQRIYEEEGQDGDEEMHIEQLTARWERDNCCDTWSVHEYALVDGDFNQPLPPGALPHGLRFLQFGRMFDQPLQHGSIPDTVEVLQFGQEFNQRLEVGHMPASLTHLVFGLKYNRPLLPGVLPAGLRQLRFGDGYRQPIQPGALPEQLQRLDLGWCSTHPWTASTLPHSLTHLKLGECYSPPLRPGSIPHGVVHLHLSGGSNQPLPAGALPISLRELVITRYFSQPLQPGSLPDGLQLLAFHPKAAFQHPLLPGLIPASVIAISLGAGYKQQLVAGAIPATVRWLRLPAAFASLELSSVVPQSTRVVWWAEGEQVEEWDE